MIGKILSNEQARNVLTMIETVRKLDGVVRVEIKNGDEVIKVIETVNELTSSRVTKVLLTKNDECAELEMYFSVEMFKTAYGI